MAGITLGLGYRRICPDRKDIASEFELDLLQLWASWACK